ncbi:MAG: RnfABCDGE type electron transport complex subunit B [Oligoflexia bacterium]|nr:RnfABCDGE type electron transport complex subunit B [Oligoflexia bacterium]
MASKKFRVERDPRVDEILEALPGANCGGCGFAGCAAFAETVVKGTEHVCPVADETSKKIIAGIMGQEHREAEPRTARVFCSGTRDNAAVSALYTGVSDCRAAKLMAGGEKSCRYSCFGLGTCKSVCPFDAIIIENGLAVILPDKCTSCGKCVEACPQMIISIVPKQKTTTIACSSHDKGPAAKGNCKVACIACMRCVKECPEKAITIKNFLAVIDYTKCVNCGKCIAVCPMKTIREVA